MTGRNSVPETVARYLRMLQLVPRGRNVDAATLQRQLACDGYTVTRRTVQRDLEQLAGNFPGLVCNRTSKPYGWSWDQQTPLHEIPAMSVQSAMTLELMRAHMVDVLPRSTLGSLKPYFQRAHITLRDRASTPMARWLRKVYVVPRGQPLRPPRVSAPVLDAAYAGLLEGRQVWVRYRKRGARQAKEYNVSPLGLIVRNGVLVLVCTMRDYQDVRQIVLHRVQTARLLDDRVREPKGFDLEAHIAQGAAAFQLGKPIRLRMLMRKEAALTLHEGHLSGDQKISSHDDEHDLIEATVPDTLELRGWLASYGGLIEVLGPASLRKHMARVAREMLARYEPDAATSRRRPAASMKVIAVDEETGEDAEGAGGS